VELWGRGCRCGLWRSSACGGRRCSGLVWRRAAAEGCGVSVGGGKLGRGGVGTRRTVLVSQEIHSGMMMEARVMAVAGVRVHYFL